MKLEMTMTFGDLIVTAGTVTAVVIAYYAIKAALTTMAANIADLTTTVAEHDDVIGSHGENIAALDAAVFGRRRKDRDAGGGRDRKD